MRFEYGPRYADAVIVRRVDFFYIPPLLVHRDVNPNKDQGFVVVNILEGRGKPVINVEGPQTGRIEKSKERSRKRRPRQTRN